MPSAPVIVESNPTVNNLEVDAGEVVILSCQVNDTFPIASILWIDQRVWKPLSYILAANNDAFSTK